MKKMEAEFVMRAREILQPLLPMSGKVIYSSAKTLTTGRLYFLGFNPGGDPDDPECHSIGKNLEGLATKTCNDYLDEEWRCRGRLCAKGRHPLQRHVQEIYQFLGCEPTQVCASNLLFTRTRNEAEAKELYERFVERCWLVHEMILGVINPRVILVYGKSTFEFIQHKLDDESSPVVPWRSGHGEWKIRTFKSRGITVIGLPHLSWYTVKGKRDAANSLRAVWPWPLNPATPADA